MFEALNKSLTSLLIRKLPKELATQIDVSFDVPDRSWSSSITKPTINIYLYDIRENLELSPNEVINSKNGSGRFVRSKLGRRFGLSYLITVWTARVEEEHRLLYHILNVLVQNPVLSELPEEILQKPLDRQPYPIKTKVAQPDSILKNLGDIWSALDNRLKPVIPYTVTLALDAYELPEPSVPEVRTSLTRFSRPNKDEKSLSTLLQVGGLVTGADGEITGAKVTLLERNYCTNTDQYGHYRFSELVPGNSYTFEVEADGYEKTRRIFTVPTSHYDFVLKRTE